MRTTLDLPEELLKVSEELLGFKSKTDTIIVSLRELIRRKRIEELKSLSGKVHLNIDLDSSRRMAFKKMTFVDTSVWINYFKGKDRILVQKLDFLLDEDQVALAVPVWMELLSGARNQNGRN